jgi:hypothetical protein
VGADIELNIVGFKIAAAEMAKSWEQFRVVETLFPPGVFCTVSENETLVAALDQALRQRMKFQLQTSDRQHPTGDRSGVEVSTVGSNDQWYPQRLEPGNYWIALNSAQPVERSVTLRRGDHLLLRLAETTRGLNLQRVVYGEEDYSWKPFQVSDAWRATVLQNQRAGDGSLRMLLGLEPNRVYGDVSLSVLRPDEAWIEIARQASGTDPTNLRWHRAWGYPIDVWDVAAPDWPLSASNESAVPQVTMWWVLDATGPSDVLLSHPADFHHFKELGGKQVTVLGQKVQLLSIAVETHYVQVAPDRREQRRCLVVRLQHPPSQTLWIRPGSIAVQGAEHRFYRQIGHYTGFFWPVTKDSVESALQQLGIVSLTTFKQAARQRGTVIELDNVPAPDPNSVGPRPLVTPTVDTAQTSP